MKQSSLIFKTLCLLFVTAAPLAATPPDAPRMFSYNNNNGIQEMGPAIESGGAADASQLLASLLARDAEPLTPLIKLQAACAAAVPLLIVPGFVTTPFVVGATLLPYFKGSSAVITRSAISGICSKPFADAISAGMDHCIPSAKSTITSSIAKAICALPISNAITARLTRADLIPQVPHRDSPQQAVAHSAVSIVAGYATNAALDRLTPHIYPHIYASYNKHIYPIIYAPYHTMMQHLDEDYTKKEKYLTPLVAASTLDEGATNNMTNYLAVMVEASRNAKVKHYHWDPRKDNSSSYLNPISFNRSIRSDSTRDAITQSLVCRILQKNSAIEVKEVFPLPADPSQPHTPYSTYTTITSDYESKGTSWNYALPFGSHRFEKSMDALKAIILQKHITIIGKTLKELEFREVKLEAEGE